MATPRWLLLAHQLPTRPSNARVKTWRRLQQVGAVQTRNSVYVLPNTEQSREDFEWIRSEIVSLGGEATIFVADAVGDEGDDAIVNASRAARQADYEALKREIDAPVRSMRRRRAGPNPGAVHRAAKQMRERFTALVRIDFFDAPGRAAAAQSLTALESLAIRRPAAAARDAAAAVSTKQYQRRRWVTRPRPGVDRMSSAWLIRRHIDPEARFACVSKPKAGDVAFDMYTGEFTHDGDLCTFEVLARRFDIRDPAVARVAQIVHDLDMKDDRYRAPDTETVGRLVEGLQAVHRTDAALLEAGIAMFEALSRSLPAKRRGAGG